MYQFYVSISLLVSAMRIEEELGIIETNEPQKSHGAGEISETVTKEVRIQKLKGLFISKEIIVSISTMLRPIHGISF